MQNTMIMSALANADFSKANESLAQGMIVENSVDVLESIVDSKPNIQQFMYRKAKQVVKEHKINRNDPCPCGAVDENGKPKKYKNCCLKTGEFENYKEV